MKRNRKLTNTNRDHSNDIFSPIHNRASTLLTMRLIDEIKASISSFKPSSSLALLAASEHSNIDQSLSLGLPPTEIDVVISGGGLKGYFMAGCASILQSELKKYNIQMARISGASAGAWAGMFILSGFDIEKWIETYHACKGNPNKLIHETYEDLAEWVKAHLPDDAYKTCTGRLHISITVLSLFGLRNKIISEYTSNDDLIECCFASSTIPYLTERGPYRRFRGEIVCDGGVTNNCPIFPDGQRRQLVFRLFEVEYPWRLLINPLDSCIDVLVLRGAILMSRFLQGEPTDSIAWLEKRKKKSDLYIKPNYYLRVALIPFVVTGIMVYKGAGLDRVADFVKTVLGFSGSGSVKGMVIVPFTEASKLLGAQQVAYVAGAVITSLVDLLRSLNLLF